LQEIKHIIHDNNNNNEDDEKIDKQQPREKKSAIMTRSKDERQNSWRHDVTSSDANKHLIRFQDQITIKYI
jgi:hypothetical protein